MISPAAQVRAERSRGKSGRDREMTNSVPFSLVHALHAELELVVGVEAAIDGGDAVAVLAGEHADELAQELGAHLAVEGAIPLVAVVLALVALGELGTQVQADHQLSLFD